MNRLFNFSAGTLMTFMFSQSLTPDGMGDLLLRQLLSLAGGVISAVVIAWLKHCWNNRQPPSTGT